MAEKCNISRCSTGPNIRRDFETPEPPTKIPSKYWAIWFEHHGTT